MSANRPITKLFVVSGPAPPPPPKPPPYIAPPQTNPKPPFGSIGGGSTGGGGQTQTQTVCFDVTDSYGYVIGRRCVTADAVIR